MDFLPVKEIFNGLSIQRKLIVINVSVTTAALLFAVIMAVAGEYINKRDFIVESLQVQAKMVAENTAVALMFKDQKGAKEVLQAFAASSNVNTAILYDAMGDIFASYRKPGFVISVNDIDKSQIPDGTRAYLHEGSAVLNSNINIAQKIHFEGESIGSLFIQADISGLYDDIINYLVYTASVALLGLALASLLLLKLSKSITRPLQQLTGLMGSVIQENDYSIRVKNNSDDEIGVLSQGFNKMLAHIQVNDEQLAFELSERYKAEEHLDKLAYYDVTTDLPNRHFFHKQLDSAVERAITTKQKMVLLFLDLDNFKIVNDTAGHKIGDLLLKQASSRLSNVLRKNDYICRIGGDEFAIIIENVNNINNVSIVTKKCIESLSNPFIFDEHKFFIGVSIGVSICPDDTITANDLLVNADMAMYEAKIRGKNNYQYFNQEMNEVHSHKYQLESDLRHAVQKNQMELYYQPQVNADNDSLAGFEVLMRWNHPEQGMIKPSEFIPIAEETGLISPLGKWLINTACQHGKQLIASGLENITIGINISAIQLRENTFVDDVTNALKSSGLDPASLEIELTESILMDDSELVIKKVNQLKSLGIHIAIDDFGTGFSSMSYLKSFPVSKLKIDKSFISGLPKSSEDMAIVRAIIAMAHGLNINVIAEGVERSDQAELLRHYDCDMFQGYYYARPMAFNDALKLNSPQKNTNNKLRIVNGK